MRILLLVIATAFAAHPGVSWADDDTPAGDAKLGQQTYKAVGCWECHGTIGQGGGTAGPRLAATALPFISFERQLRVPRSAMPPYEAKIVPDSDVANIYAYLRSIPEPKQAKDIPLLSELK